MAGSPKYKPLGKTQAPTSAAKPSSISTGFRPKPVWVGFILAGGLCLAGLLFMFGNFGTTVRRRGMAGPQFNHDPITLQAHYNYIDEVACQSKACRSSSNTKSFSKFAAKPSLVHGKDLANATEHLRKLLLTGISQKDVRSTYRQFLTRKSNGQLETSFNVEQRRLRPVKAFLQSAFAAFPNPSVLLQCAYDPLMGLTLTHSGKKGCLKYVLAAHIKDGAADLPNFIVQTLRVVLALPPGSVYVSIVGGSKTDETSRFLEVFKLLLVPIEVSARIETQNELLLSQPTDPVKWAADVRNLVVAPFFDKKSNPSGAVGATPNCFNPDYIVYMSQAAFCPHDVIRLMLHRVDITCGMSLATAEVDSYGKRKLLQSAASDAPNSLAESAVAASKDSGKPRSLQQAYWDEYGEDYEDLFGSYELYEADYEEFYTKQTTFTMAEAVTVRDISGKKPTSTEPFFQHKESAGRAKAGKPVQVYCCWSNVVVLSATPFKNGVRFRVNQNGECASSEKSLLCDDFHRVNHDMALVDASVRTMRTVMDYKSMHVSFEERMGFKTWPWQNAVGSEPAPLPHDSEDHTHVQCCDRAPNTESYSSTCRDVNTMATNYTKAAFP